MSTRIRSLRLWAAIVACVIASGCAADDRDFEGVVTRVFDGDSFIVTADHKPKRREVRLADIDAPEKGQPHADKARDTLREWLQGKRVFVDVLTYDRFDRAIARVYRLPDRVEMGPALVEEGHAWVNRRFAKDGRLVTLEDRARARGAGLWSSEHTEPPVAPWEFRRSKQSK